MREQTQKENELDAIASLLSDRSEAGVYAKVDGLLAEQTRLREALQAVKDYWTRYGFSGWKGDDDFDRLSKQIDAALSSTPTPETTP